MVTLQTRLLADVDAILGPKGMLARAGDARLHFNAQQHEYARRAAAGFTRFDAETGRTAINMLQAATGTGKTLGYLVPLMLFAAYGKGKPARVAVSTYTRHLQKQIIDQDAVRATDWVASVTGVRLNVGLRMGIGNFVSEHAAARLYDALKHENTHHRFDDALDFLDEIIEWSGETDKSGARVNSGLLYDFLEDRGLGSLPPGINPDAIALDHHAHDDEKVAYQAMIAASKNVDVLVVNHSLLVTNALRWSALLDDPDKRPITALVCDEADRLAGAAESVTSAGLSLHQMTRTCSALADDAALKSLSRLNEYIEGMKVPQAEAVAINNHADLVGHLRATLSVLRPIGAECANRIASDPSPGSPRLVDLTFLDMLVDLETIVAAADDREATAVVSWSPVRQYPSLRIGRAHPGRILSRLWNLRRNTDDPTLPPQRGYLDAVLMTSATLETPGLDLPRAFDEFAGSVGVVRHARKEGNGIPIHNVTTDLFSRFEPARFGRMRFVLASPSAPLPTERSDDEENFTTSPEWLEYVSGVVRTARAAGGRTLVLTLSWKDTDAVGDRLEGERGVIVHRRGQSLREAVTGYLAARHTVLITPSAWEGLDLPGAVQQLVITRIPYAPKDVSGDAHRRIHYEHLGYSRDKIDAILHGARVSAMRRKLAQGFGRGIRAHDDDVTVWLGDPRFPLPDSFSDSLDPVLIEAPDRPVRAMLRYCIPPRFRETTYPKARLCLEDGTVHTISDLG